MEPFKTIIIIMEDERTRKWSEDFKKSKESSTKWKKSFLPIMPLSSVCLVNCIFIVVHLRESWMVRQTGRYCLCLWTLFFGEKIEICWFLFYVLIVYLDRNSKRMELNKQSFLETSWTFIGSFNFKKGLKRKFSAKKFPFYSCKILKSTLLYFMLCFAFSIHNFRICTPKSNTKIK